MLQNVSTLAHVFNVVLRHSALQAPPIDMLCVDEELNTASRYVLLLDRRNENN